MEFPDSVEKFIEATAPTEAEARAFQAIRLAHETLALARQIRELERELENLKREQEEEHEG